MKRSAMTRKTPMPRGKAMIRSSEPARQAVNPSKCAACRAEFFRLRPKQKACKPECAQQLAQDKRLKDERKQDKAKRENLKTLGQLEAECRIIAQRIARVRDRNDGCISCHMGPNYDGQWHGSHYRAHGGCSSLQMHLWNIHKACAQCNLFKGGNKEGFIRGLLVKPGYGRERLEWLDAQPTHKRFTRDYLLRYKKVMGKRAKRLEKASA